MIMPVHNRPHNGWLDLAKPFISAYKAGASSPNSYITSDEIIYWYRINQAALDCDATDTTMVPANNGSGKSQNQRVCRSLTGDCRELL